MKEDILDNQVIIFAAPNCKKCKILTSKLTERKIAFRVQYVDEELVIQLIQEGFVETPVMQVNGSRMSFSDSIKWIRSLA